MSPQSTTRRLGPVYGPPTCSPRRSQYWCSLAEDGRQDAFVADLTKHPGHFEEQHPLDAYVKRCIDDASSVLGDTPHRWFFAPAGGGCAPTFGLAVRAGFGAPSRLGLVIDGVYGPWMGLRAGSYVRLTSGV